jgi:hypothetical protein
MNVKRKRDIFLNGGSLQGGKRLNMGYCGGLNAVISVATGTSERRRASCLCGLRY